MNIVSKFTTSIISKLVRVMIKKKLGYDVYIQINEIKVANADGETHVHLDADAGLGKDELMKILKSLGL